MLRFSFTFKCTLAGKSYPEATARTKKDAKKNAAELALREIHGTTQERRVSPTSNSNSVSVRTLIFLMIFIFFYFILVSALEWIKIILTKIF